MNRLILLLAVVALSVASCDEPGSYEPEKKTVEAEFINPTADTLYARIFDEGGWIINIAVAPFSSVVEQVEEGLFTVGAMNTDGKLQQFYPSGVSAENLKDTVNFGITTDPEDGSKSVRYRFRNRNYKNMFVARHAFDLSFDPKNTYVVADLQWMYGVENEKSMREEFMRVTNQGKKFVLSTGQGDNVLIVPEKVSGPFEEIPEAITVYYNTKHVFPKFFIMPDSVEAKESANHLVRELILD